MSTTIIAADKTHAVLSASAAHRWMVCPGSIGRYGGLKGKSSAYADEGNAAHAVAEACLTGGTSAGRYLGAQVAMGPQKFEVTEEMAAAVDLYIDAVARDLARLPGAVLHVESKVDLAWCHPSLGGTVDAAIDQPFGELVIHDFKFGEGRRISPIDNPQQKVYALGYLGPNPGDYEKLTLVIDQPRAHEEPWAWETTATDLHAWGMDVLRPAAEAALKDDAPLVPGDHCWGCPAASRCEALRKQAAEAALITVDPITIDRVPTLPRPEDLTPDQKRRVVALADVLSVWSKAVRESLKDDLVAGRVTPEEVGHKLVRAEGRRKWADEAAVTGALHPMLGAELFDSKLRSPAQVEKMLKKLKVKLDLSPLTIRPETTAMVDLADKRPAIQPAIEAFNEIDPDA